ncbi:hypothetical protein BH11PSE11_BH11PSE11_00120 [soil metagenome]
MKIETPFSPGFRISVTDIIVLMVGAIASACLAGIDLPLGLAIAFVVAHFFLFCNVIRMARRLELAWAAIFVGLAGCTILLQVPGWSVTFAASFLATMALVVVQMRRPSYHGVLWRRINPNLPRWWQTHGRGKN